MKKSRTKLIIFLTLSALILAFIFYNSSRTPAESNGTSEGIMTALLRFIDPKGKLDTGIVHYLIRKGAHFIEYLVYGACLCGAALAGQEMTGVFRGSLTLLAAMSSAVIDETIQSFTGRTASPRDIILDFCGAACGVLIAWLVSRSRKRRKKA